MHHLLWARRNQQRGVETDAPPHGRGAVDDEGEHFLEPSVGNRHREVHRPPSPVLGLDDAAGHANRRARPEQGLGRLDVRVAVRAVHDHGEAGRQGQGAPAHVEVERWCRAGAHGLDALEHAGVRALGLEDAGDAANRVQVGIHEPVPRLKGRPGRCSHVPGPEGARRLDPPARLRILDDGVEGHGPVGRDVAHRQLVQDESARELSRLARQDDQRRGVGGDAPDDDRRRPSWRSPALRPCLLPSCLLPACVPVSCVPASAGLGACPPSSPACSVSPPAPGEGGMAMARPVRVTASTRRGRRIIWRHVIVVSKRSSWMSGAMSRRRR